MEASADGAGRLLDRLRAAVDRPTRTLSLRRGDRLFRRGEPVSSLFLLTAGRVRLERSLEDGSWVALHVARGPALLAEASLFGERYHCDGVAEVASRVLELSRPAVERALEAHPELSWMLLRVLSREVRDLRSRLELRSVRPMERRVLLGLELDRCAERTVAGRAAELGVAPETLSRTLSRLERQGRIVRDGRTIRLRKP